MGLLVRSAPRSTFIKPTTVHGGTEPVSRLEELPELPASHRVAGIFMPECGPVGRGSLFVEEMRPGPGGIPLRAEWLGISLPLRSIRSIRGALLKFRNQSIATI